MKRQLAIEIICFLLVILFLYAALMKLWDMQKFIVQLNQSPLLMAFAPLVAWVVPSIEVIIAAMLIFSRTRLVALYSSFTLMIMFTTYIVVILNFARHIPCSCGGILEKMGWTEHLIFNIVFIFLSGIGAVLEANREFTSQGESKSQLTPVAK